MLDRLDERLARAVGPVRDEFDRGRSWVSAGPLGGGRQDVAAGYQHKDNKKTIQ